MAKLQPPEAFDFSHPEKWPEWRRRFERYRIATKLNKETAEIQINTLVYTMGEDADNILDTLPLTEENRMDYDRVMTAFHDHFVPRANPVHWRAMLRRRMQADNENIETYVRVLFELAKKCDFRDKNIEVRDQLVIGMKDREVSKSLQADAELTLDKAVTKARQEEALKEQLSYQAKSVNSTANIDAFNRKKHHPRNGKKSNQSSRPTPTPSTTTTTTSSCRNCGGQHPPRRCLAFNKTCNKCGKLGHFAKMCRSSNDKTQQHEIQATRSNTNNDPNFTHDTSAQMFVGEMKVQYAEPWYVTLNVCGSRVQFKIDSGADVNVISEHTYNQLGEKPELTPSNKRFESVGTNVEVIGLFTSVICHGDTDYVTQIYVARTDAKVNLLSRSTSYAMGLIAVRSEQLQELQISDTVFGQIGLMKTSPVDISLRDNAEPYNVGTPRTVPIPLKPKVADELDMMERSGVIKRVTEPTDWCSPMSVVPKKNGSVRLCVDLRKLNKAVKRESYTLPTFDDILPNLAGSKYYSILDASRGYWQIPLSENSSKLTTFITDQGRYQFVRLPYGICNASEIFQRKMTELLEGIEGVECYQDDIIVYAENEIQHDARLTEVLKVIEASGLKLNREKCLFKQKSISFLGHMIDENGCHPDPAKVKAIVDLPPPTADNLRSLVGMINYLGRYVPNLQTIMQPINDLLRDDVQFEWGERQIKALDTIKAKLIEAPSLAFFDPKLKTVVSADSSSYGIGGVLLQLHDDKLLPVAFCSRTLNDAEKGYAQIEKECLASTWTCEKFTRFLVGLEFTLQTDHKPLVPLLSVRDIYKAPARIQRFLMRLMPFTFTPVHIPGKYLTVADGLSRSPTEGHDNPSILELTEDCEAMVDAIDFPATTEKLDIIRKACAADPFTSAIMNYTLTGWPKRTRDLPEELRDLPHGHFNIAHGLLLHDDQIVIPRALQADMLSRIHDGHWGITKSRERARACVWWPKMSQDIANYVKNCEHCQENRPAQRREPLIPSAPPSGPWKCIAADLLHFKGRNYLVVIDYYSKYIELCYLPSKTTSTVVGKLSAIIARWGVPDLLRTDNGPEFASQEFRDFSRRYGFNHVTSSPRYPQSNGMAESAVKIAKAVLNQDDPCLGLLVYRATPCAATGFSPAQLMMGRNIKTTLPIIPKKLETAWPNKQQVEERILHHNERMAKVFNAHNGVRPLPPLNVGDRVAVKTDDDKQWDNKGVVQENVGHRSYIIKTENGSELRRNRRHINVAPAEQPESEVVSVDPPEEPRRSTRTSRAPQRLIEEI